MLIMKALNLKLERLSEQIHQKEKWMHHLKEIQNSLDRDIPHLAKLKIKLADEQYDFERFEGVSFTGWIYKVLGQREEKLEKERGEYLKAKLLYDQYNSLVKHLEAKEATLLTKLSALENVEIIYQATLNEKEKFMIEHENPHLEILTNLARKENHLSRRIKDKEAAVTAAQPVIVQLEKIKLTLEKAIKWAKRDVRGRKNSERYKYRAVDKATKELNTLGILIANLNIELKGENLSVNGQIKMPYFDRMTDYLTGALGYDREVLKKLKGVLAAHEAIVKEIYAVLGTLKTVINSYNQDLATTIKERKEIIRRA